MPIPAQFGGAAELVFGILEHFDGFADLRNKLRQAAAERLDYAGIPMPLEHQKLVIEPTYPGGAGLAAIGRPEKDFEDEPGIRLRNSWRALSFQGTCFAYEENGRIRGAKLYRRHHFGMDIETMACSAAWGIEQESNAVRLLGTLLSHRMFKSYLLTGMFIETSKRSGVTYVFRKLKPTVALSPRPNTVFHRKTGGEEMRILAALCMHPIAFYSGTWAGAMTPTDDVVAHLMLMRGDEAMFWRRCNQHPSDSPEAGL